MATYASPVMGLPNLVKWSLSAKKINFKQEPAVANAIKAVSRVLSHENFVRPDPGKEFKICLDHPSALGFTTKNKRGIPVRPSGICERGLEQSNRDLAQTIIHEAAHQGYPTENECAATFAELEIVIQGGGVPYKNIYVSKCAEFKVLSRFRRLD